MNQHAEAFPRLDHARILSLYPNDLLWQSSDERIRRGLDLAFPKVHPGMRPHGSRVLVQLRAPKRMSEGGLVLVEETKETERAQGAIAKVIALGPLAYRNRESMEPWKEGAWCLPGDFVRVPKWGGDRWERPVPEHDTEVAWFAFFQDHEIIGDVLVNPLEIKAFV